MTVGMLLTLPVETAGQQVPHVERMHRDRGHHQVVVVGDVDAVVGLPPSLAGGETLVDLFAGVDEQAEVVEPG